MNLTFLFCSFEGFEPLSWIQSSWVYNTKFRVWYRCQRDYTSLTHYCYNISHHVTLQCASSLEEDNYIIKTWNFPIWNTWMHTVGLIDFTHLNVWIVINVFCAIHFKDCDPNIAKHSILFKHLQESTQASMQTCKLQHSSNIRFAFSLTFYQIFLFFMT
jgi:hypothetical protein